MWLVLKLKNIKKLSEFKNSLNQFLGNTSVFYLPKIKKNYIKGSKILEKDHYIFDNYIFVYNENFNKNAVINKVNFLKGISYVLNGVKNSQQDITRFIENCKKNQNCDGYLMQSFFEKILNQKMIFVSGPFVNFVTEIIKVQKDKISAFIGNYTITLSNKSNCILSKD